MSITIEACFSAPVPTASRQIQEGRMTVTLDKLCSMANRIAVMDSKEPRIQEIQNRVQQTLDHARLMLLTDFTPVEISDHIEDSMSKLEVCIANYHLFRMENTRSGGHPIKHSPSLTEGNSLHFSNDRMHFHISKL